MTEGAPTSLRQDRDKLGGYIFEDTNGLFVFLGLKEEKFYILTKQEEDE